MNLELEKRDDKILRSNNYADTLGRLDSSLFIVVSVLLVGIFILLSINLYLQWYNYNRAISFAINNGDGNSAILTYSRAMDFAFTKATALCLGFLLVFVGALYLLRVNQSAYSIALSGGSANVSLQTSSPGLVIVTLGVITVLFTIYNKSYISFSGSPVVSNEKRDITDIQDLTRLIKFEYGGTDLTEESVSAISNLCRYIRANNISSISVEGFGDGDGDKGREYQMALGERRGALIRERLMKECTQKLSVNSYSYGEEPSSHYDSREGNIVIKIKE